MEYMQQEFRDKVSKALKELESILEVNRTFKLAEDVPHSYEDKFGLAEFISQSAIAAVVQCMHEIGIGKDLLCALRERVLKDGQPVSLRFSSTERCSYIKETKTVDRGNRVYVLDEENSHGVFRTLKSMFRTTITKSQWQYAAEYSIHAFVGSAGDVVDKELRVINAEPKLMTMLSGAKDDRPFPEVSSKHHDVNITWLLRHIDSEASPEFTIDRFHSCCRTPKNNQEVKEAQTNLVLLKDFATEVTARLYLYHSIATQRWVKLSDKPPPTSLFDVNAFVPVLPFLEDLPCSSEINNAIAANDFVKFVDAQRQDLDEQLRRLDANFTAPREDEEEEEEVETHQKERATSPRGPKAEEPGIVTGIFLVDEAKRIVVFNHIRRISEFLSDSIAYLEAMLHGQLVAAIGKQIQPKDFMEFMDYHVRHLLADAYVPKQFAFAVRRPGHSPEGVLSLHEDASLGGEAISSFCRSQEPAVSDMHIPLDAATSVKVGGARFVHGYIRQQFRDSKQSPRLMLQLRARQFSRFLVVIGTIAGKDLLVPKFTVVLRNKDLLQIPLHLEQIPTAKEFKDAISSLSPEQQRFAKAIRSMQLQGTLFAVCVFEIRPQLERVLNVPPDSLTKHIRLTEDILDLFVRYNIPSDLLAWDPQMHDGDGEASVKTKIEAVEKAVEEIKQVILQFKQQDEQLTREELCRPFEIYVKTLTGKTLTLVVNKVTPIFQVKEMICAREGISIDQQRMVFAGKQLENHLLVGSYDIASESTVHLILRLRGGDGPPSPPSEPPTSETTLCDQDREEEQPQEPQAWHDEKEGPATVEEEDYTLLPSLLDRLLEALDEDSAVRPTILKVAPDWLLKRQKSLLSSPEETTMTADGQKSADAEARDLLDALSRSGALRFDCASVHVVMCFTHVFSRSLIDTIISDNINPIEKVERSMLIIASTLLRQHVESMLRPEQVERVRQFSPNLFSAPTTS